MIICNLGILVMIHTRCWGGVYCKSSVAEIVRDGCACLGPTEGTTVSVLAELSG